MAPKRHFPLLAATAAVALLATPLLAGCLTQAPTPTPQAERAYEKMGFDGTHWPDLHGATVTLLTYQAFPSSLFTFHKNTFHNLTNGTLEIVRVADAGKILEKAVQEKGNPSFDVLYGIDNLLVGKARREGVFAPYKPVLADRIEPTYRFVDDWVATPVDHGYISVNVDNRSPLNATVHTLADVRAHASDFVTEDPRTSTPGLGFLISTVATYGEKSAASYDYIDYWNDLFHNGTLVTASWSIAYENHFTGGYGQWATGFQGNRELVTSYSTSPAYERYYGYDQLNPNVLAPKATFHQIQLMGAAKGTKNLAAAEAFIEYALTPAFQGKAASDEAIYPVVAGVNTADVYGGRDPQPGTFQDAGFTAEQLDQNVERWVREWTDAYERAHA